jgi:hypothetical protein
MRNKNKNLSKFIIKKLLFQRPDSFTSIHLLKLTRLLRLARLLQKMDRYLLLSLIDHGINKKQSFLTDFIHLRLTIRLKLMQSERWKSLEIYVTNQNIQFCFIQPKFFFTGKLLSIACKVFLWKKFHWDAENKSNFVGN